MTYIPGLSPWQALVSTHLPHLSVPQSRTLALWSFAIVLTQGAGLIPI